MAVKEKKTKHILGPLIPKKAKLKKANKEIVLKKVSGKKPKNKEALQDNDDSVINDLKLRRKKNKKKHIKEGEKETLQTDDIMEESGETKSKKQKKIKKHKVESNDAVGEPKEDNDVSVDSESIGKKPKKQKKRKLSETDILDSGDEETTEVPRKKKKNKQKKQQDEEEVSEDPEIRARTVFVGNVPLKTTKKALKKYFRKYGDIEAIRIRGLPAANPKLSKKVVAIKQEFHPERNNFICYIRYQNKEDAIKSQAENGALFEGHHLRVHCCGSSSKPDESKAIFIGNLPFNATEDELWKLFEDCGPISSVRIIRDTYSGMGKGFAYVNFKDSDAVQLALEMEDVKLKNRELRITLSNTSVAKKNKKMNKKKEITKPGQPRIRKPFRKNGDVEDSGENQNFQGKKKGGFVPKGKRSFQGSKFTDKKKKFKKDKGLKEKKKKIKMIAPKTE